MRNLLFAIWCAVSTVGFSQLTNNGATILIEEGATLTLSGNIANTNSGSIVNTGDLVVYNDLNNTGNINSATPAARIIFEGSDPSNFTVGNIDLSILEIRKSNANLILNGDLEIDDSVIFNSQGSGSIILNTSDLILDHTAAFVGASAQEYVETNGTSFLIKEMNSAGSFTFPVGNGQGRTKLETDVSGSSFVNAKLKVRVSNTADPNLPIGVNDFLNRYWTVDAENIGTYENDVTGTYLPSDVAGQEMNINGASYSSSAWSFLNASRGSNSVLATLTANSSTFTGRELAVPLPVELSNFVADKSSSNSVQLSWNVASEFNTSHYTIERSTDASNWGAIGKVKAVGFTNESTNYAYNDEEIPQVVASNNLLYYRLQIVDHDGFSEYSTVEAVSFTDDEVFFKVFPNPTKSTFSLATASPPDEILVFNAVGKLVLKIEDSSEVNLESLQAGLYKVSARTGQLVQFASVVKTD